MNKKKKIAFICTGDPNNNKLWSGTITQIYKILKKNNELILIDISYNKKIVNFFNKIIYYFIKIFTKKKYNSIYSIINAKIESLIVQNKIKNKNIDLIFCPAKSSSIAFLNTAIPIIYLTDATFNQMIDYYDYLSNLCKLTIWCGNFIEKKAIQKSNNIIVSSDWTKQSIINDYKYYEKNIELIQFGANINNIKSKVKIINNEIKILFCGVDWKRKGGQIVLDTFYELKKRKYNIKLYLIGCKVPFPIKNNDICNLGFLDKNNTNELKKLYDIYYDMNFLLLPTKSECAGIVFAEASGFGIPSITYDTGGISSYVLNGINGYRLSVNSSYIDFANIIEKCILEKELYKKLQLNARKYYESNLCWDVWEEKFNLLLRKNNNN